MREEMFVPAQGDRDGVPNFGVLLSDGESSDRPAAFEEVAKVHASNIIMLALGVAVRSRRDRCVRKVTLWCLSVYLQKQDY